MDKLFTVKEIAELLEVSKPTVQRAINTAAIEADQEDNKHTRSYCYDKTVEIIKSIKQDFDFAVLAKQTETPQNLGETPPQTPPNEPKQTETPPQTSELELVKSMLATIQEQLTIKDKQIAAYEEQIAVKDKQIEDYSARLAEAMQLTKGQQYIAAADKVERITAAQTKIEEEPLTKTDTFTADPDPEEQQPKKKSFWQRIFNK